MITAVYSVIQKHKEVEGGGCLFVKFLYYKLLLLSKYVCVCIYIMLLCNCYQKASTYFNIKNKSLKLSLVK